MPDLLQRLDRLLYALAPAALIAVLILLTLAPVRFAYVPAAAPLLPLMAVYHYCLFRAEALPAPLLFAFGIVFDLLQGGATAPVGISSLQFLLVRQAILRNRRYLLEVSFSFIWIGYALLSAAAVAMAWALSSLLSWTAIDPKPALFQYVVSLFLYPILGWILGRGRRRDALNTAGNRR
ncbi:MAG: hypothetical protein IPK81_19050 [Rhodospirillales bacterium]|nr:hypothetical protein [Rhodospirillales bacterium]QQS11644.1 MAG: hypothetical protein IPK81_19050 [Rhodospirillales bacterium]